MSKTVTMKDNGMNRCFFDESDDDEDMSVGGPEKTEPTKIPNPTTGM